MSWIDGDYHESDDLDNDDIEYDDEEYKYPSQDEDGYFIDESLDDDDWYPDNY